MQRRYDRQDDRHDDRQERRDDRERKESSDRGSRKKSPDSSRDLKTDHRADAGGVKKPREERARLVTAAVMTQHLYAAEESGRVKPQQEE